MKQSWILKGHIVYSVDQNALSVTENGYLVCVDGKSAGVFREIPEKYAGLPVEDCGDRLIVPGFTDLHVHAPQYTFRSLGMDM
ncbi:MAG: guanine deaminase, partial [Butyricicoccus sp.]